MFGKALIASVTVPVLAAVTSSDPKLPVVQPDGDLNPIVAGFASVPVDDPAKEDDARWALARLDFNGALNAGVGVPVGSKVTTDFLDAPFAPVDGEPPFLGFDPKAPPARVDV